MIEELEAEAVLQMVNDERGGLRGLVTRDHQGAAIEVRARRRRDGAAVLGYSYEGVRVERSALLLLICPQAACERSQSVKKAWAARNPPAPALQRRPRTGAVADAHRVEARLFEETSVRCPGGLCVARPASFAVLAKCPVNAHLPITLRMEGWDVFSKGKYLAGGLMHSEATGASTPKFATVEEAILWVRRFVD